MNDFKLYFIESFSMINDVSIGLVQLTKFRCSILEQYLFIRMYKFSLSPVSCSHLKIRTVFFNAQNLIAIVKFHLKKIVVIENIAMSSN